jgi:hypothetical protein
MVRSFLALNLALLLAFGLSAVVISQSAEAKVIGAWLFDERNGDEALDSSARNVDGVLVGNPERMDGKFGGALKFEPSKYVDFPPPLSETMILEKDFSCMAWVYPNEWIGSYQGVMSMQAGSSNGETYGFYFDQGGKRIAIYLNIVGAGGQNLKTDVGTVELATWTHVAVTYDGSKLTIYLNGEVAAQRDLSGNLDNRDGLGRFVINGNYNSRDGGLAEWCSATVDEVLIFDEALTQAQIKAYMEKGFKGVAPVDPAGKLAGTWAEIKASQ